MQTTYSKTFKIEAVKKVLSRGAGEPINSIARSLNVKISTLHGWLKAMENKELREIPASGDVSEKIPYNWSAKEKFEAILETSNLSLEEISEYCRKKGIFPHHLERWKVELIEGFDKKKLSNGSHEVKTLKDENKRLGEANKKLSKELRRKEKALAETAALLVLKKKVEEYWGTDEGA